MHAEFERVCMPLCSSGRIRRESFPQRGAFCTTCWGNTSATNQERPGEGPVIVAALLPSWKHSFQSVPDGLFSLWEVSLSASCLACRASSTCVLWLLPTCFCLFWSFFEGFEQANHWFSLCASPLNPPKPLLWALTGSSASTFSAVTQSDLLQCTAHLLEPISFFGVTRWDKTLSPVPGEQHLAGPSTTKPKTIPSHQIEWLCWCGGADLSTWLFYFPEPKAPDFNKPKPMLPSRSQRLDSSPGWQHLALCRHWTSQEKSPSLLLLLAPLFVKFKKKKFSAFGDVTEDTDTSQNKPSSTLVVTDSVGPSTHEKGTTHRFQQALFKNSSGGCQRWAKCGRVGKWVRYPATV